MATSLFLSLFVKNRIGGISGAGFPSEICTGAQHITFSIQQSENRGTDWILNGINRNNSRLVSTCYEGSGVERRTICSGNALRSLRLLVPPTTLRLWAPPAHAAAGGHRFQP